MPDQTESYASPPRSALETALAHYGRPECGRRRDSASLRPVEEEQCPAGLRGVQPAFDQRHSLLARGGPLRRCVRCNVADLTGMLVGMAIMVLLWSLHGTLEIKTQSPGVNAASGAGDRMKAEVKEAVLPSAAQPPSQPPLPEQPLTDKRQSVTTTGVTTEVRAEESQAPDAEVSQPELAAASQQLLPGMDETDEFVGAGRDTHPLPEMLGTQSSLVLSGEGCKGTGPPPQKSDWKKLNKKKPPCGGRLNFLFMAMDSLYHLEVWQDFFASAPLGAWRAWIHCAKPSACRDSLITDQLPGLQMVETVKSLRCYDLVSVEAQLMKEALKQRVRGADVIQKYVLVSESTLPAKPFSVVYRALTAYRESDFCFSQPQYFPEALLQYRREGNVYKIQRGGEKRSLLVKHSQFAILNRLDASTFSDKWQGLNKTIGWKVPLKSKRWTAGVRGNPAIPSNAFLWYHDKDRAWVGTCADEFALFATCYGTFEPGDWTGECPLNQSTECNDLESLMRQRRCPTLSVGGQNNSFVAALMNDSGSVLKLPSWRQRGHGFEFVKLGIASLNRIRASQYLFVRKFAPDSEIPHYSAVVFRS